ncbi:SDR family NAD(P)-dependent oxidoreductase [Aspergillus lucknowensis]|uniref:Ketoreductase domain-containing protein n=1 Tax=Aspergillus lucknowensis TaxID=176173 RepID=A0ABR4LX68_9EURO
MGSGLACCRTLLVLTPNPILNRLRGLLALVTGAAGNIGYETARRFLLEGALVALVDLDGEKLARSTEALRNLEQSNEDAVLTVRADVADDEDVQRFVGETINTFGRLDIAFLCAGISYSSTSILDTDVEQYDRVMRVNCRGSIILASSIAGLRATPGLSAYSTSKFALRSLCLTAATELGRHKIRVNTVHPCDLNTPIFLASWPEETMKSMLATVLLGQWAEVADVAAMVSFLGSPNAQFQTGGA